LQKDFTTTINNLIKRQKSWHRHFFLNFHTFGFIKEALELLPRHVVEVFWDSSCGFFFLCFPSLPLWCTHHYDGELKLTMCKVFGLLANLEEEDDGPPPITMDHHEATCNVYGKVHPLSLKMGARSCCICYCRSMGSKKCWGHLWALMFSCKPWRTRGRWNYIWLLPTFLNMTTMIVVMALLLKVQNYLMLVKHHGC
jgi:hypothetical protein